MFIDLFVFFQYFPEAPTTDTDDQRLFLVYYTSLGHVLIQPKHHKNYYLHHIDHALSVQLLDLNWRCPEEYFFHFNAMPEPEYRYKPVRQLTCSHKTNSQTDETENDNSVDCQKKETDSKKGCKKPLKVTKSEPLRELPVQCEKVLLPTRKVCKSKQSFKNLFIGCFTDRGRMLSVNEA